MQTATIVINVSALKNIIFKYNIIDAITLHSYNI